MLVYFIISAALILSILEGVIAVSSNSDLDVFKRTDARTLFPVSKRTSGLRTRDVIRRALHPETEVVLSYGEDFHSHEQPQLFFVDVTLIAHEEFPVLLLESFEELASSIVCSQDSITITFSDSSDLDYTRDVWSPLETFILISSHPGSSCNPIDERSAYIVEDIHWDEEISTATLSVVSLSLGDAASKISVDFGHIKREEFRETLTKRQTSTDEVEDDGTMDYRINGTMSLEFTFPPRANLWPLLEDVEIDGGNNGESPLDVGIACIDCSVDGEVLFRGHFDQDFAITDGDFDFELEWAWIEIEVTKAIKSHILLEFFFSLTRQEWTIPLLPIPISLSPLQVPGLLTIGPEFNYDMILGVFLNNTNVNFTYGATVEIPVNSIAKFDLQQLNASYAQGWNGTTVNQLPITINALEGDLEFGANITLQPSVGLMITLLPTLGGATAGPSVNFAAPKFTVTASEAHNVTANCTVPGPDDYEYYEDAFTISTGWELGVSISLSAGVDIPLLPALGMSISQDLYTHAFTPDLTCRVFDHATSGELKLADTVVPEIDIVKVQSAVSNTGSLPTGVNADQLATYTDAGVLPTSVQQAVENAQNGAGNTRALGGFGMLSLLMVVAGIAIVL